MKTNTTIAITLANRAVYRNLFFFEGGFFTQLIAEAIRRPGLRVVLLTIPKDAGKFAKMIGVAPKGQFFVETVDVLPARSFLERTFYFFYSYLIYTGTTSLLATMQIRPDEPPAGGRLALAPIKWLISRTTGRIDVVKRRLVPNLFRRVFSARPFENVFDRYKPDLLFATHLYGWYDAHAIREAKERGVKTIGMPAGWDHLDKYFLPLHVDRLLVQSEEVREAAIKHQNYRAREIAVVGYPHFDFITDEKIHSSREKVLSSLGFPRDAKFLLYVSGSAYCPDEPDIIEKILEWADAGVFDANVHLVIKPYIGGRGKDRAFDEEKFNRFAEHPRVHFYRNEIWNDPENSRVFVSIMRHADIVLGMYTTIVLEAAAIDRPLLAAAFDGYTTRPINRSIRRFERMDHFRHVLETGALPTAYSFDALREEMSRLLAHPEIHARERALLRARLAGPLDHRASERVLTEVISALSG